MKSMENYHRFSLFFGGEDASFMARFNACLFSLIFGQTRDPEHCFRAAAFRYLADHHRRGDAEFVSRLCDERDRVARLAGCA